VIRYHFNGVPIVSDVRDLRGDQIEPVDVVTFGSPCQDMSVAGNRKGISGERSGLFFEAIRIIREMREATHDLYPRYAVWENVPGAFTSHRGQDFRAVLEAFAESEIPMPGTRRWAPAGVVRGAGRSITWRTIDAQYWGVPQRRDRIYLVTDFRGQSAPEILFERQGVSGNLAESREAGEKVAAVAGDGVTYGFSAGQSGEARSIAFSKEVAPPVRAGVSGTNQAPTILTAGFNGWRSTTGTLEYAEERAPAINRTMPPNIVGTILGSGAGTARSGGGESETDLYIAEAYGCDLSQKADGIGFQKEQSSCIAPGTHAGHGNHVLATYERIGHGEYAPGVAPLQAKNGDCGGGSETLIAQTIAFIGKNSAKTRSIGESVEVSPTIDSGGSIEIATFGPADSPEVSHAIRAGASRADKPDSTTYIAQGYRVRRLTPLECLRCFGYPDTWLDIAGLSDTAKYRMCGNSIAIPCARFVMRRIAERLRA
jgi:DNA (cytosine-5)-methyltransferase 1